MPSNEDAMPPATLKRVERVGQLWDRALVRAVLSAIAVIVLVAGVIVYASSRDGVKVADVPGSALAGKPNAERLYGAKIAMPKAALTTARSFIDAAVLRKDVAAAWGMSTPRVHGGLTQSRWDTGNIPIVPYPRAKFGGARFKVDRSRQRDILLEVLLSSHKQGVAPVDFFMELVPSGAGRWLVANYAPRGVNPPLPAAQP
jgi:hypothetical protein